MTIIPTARVVCPSFSISVTRCCYSRTRTRSIVEHASTLAVKPADEDVSSSVGSSSCFNICTMGLRKVSVMSGANGCEQVFWVRLSIILGRTCHRLFGACSRSVVDGTSENIVRDTDIYLSVMFFAIVSDYSFYGILFLNFGKITFICLYVRNKKSYGRRV